MSIKDKKIIDKKKIKKNNPQIDNVLVEKCEMLETQMKRFGADIKSRYSIEPSLASGSSLYLYNH